MTKDREELPLSKSAQYLLEECRMVLPGMQALFGFELIVVFNESFSKKLHLAEQSLHLVALSLVAIATALVMTPAAIHRRTGPQKISQSFIDISTRLLLWSMLPLAIGICLDFYLIVWLILGSVLVAIALAIVLFGIFTLLWFVFPWLEKKRNR